MNLKVLSMNGPAISHSVTLTDQIQFVPFFIKGLEKRIIQTVVYVASADGANEYGVDPITGEVDPNGDIFLPQRSTIEYPVDYKGEMPGIYLAAPTGKTAKVNFRFFTE